MMTRPVLIVGPLADTVVDKLVSEHPNGMVRCQPEYVDSDMKALEKGVMDNVFVDFKRRGSHYECTTVSSIREICDRVSCFLESVRGTILSLFVSPESALYPGRPSRLCGPPSPEPDLSHRPSHQVQERQADQRGLSISLLFKAAFSRSDHHLLV